LLRFEVSMQDHQGSGTDGGTPGVRKALHELKRANQNR
jgi:hypothetical protein